MGQHRTNPNALFNKSLPPQPIGIGMQSQVVAQKVLRRGLLLLAADKVRETDGKTEVFGAAPLRSPEGKLVMGPNGEMQVAEEPTWHAPPEGWTVKILGEPLTDDDFEIAHVLINIVEHRTIVTGNGQPMHTVVELGEVCPRVPFKQLLGAHEAQKGGVNGAAH